MANIVINQVYHLDLSGGAPVEVQVLEILNEYEVRVKYLSSWEGREEILPISLF